MKVKVELEVTIPDGYELEDIEEFLKFELGGNGGVSINNPLYKDEVEYDVDNFYIDIL